MEVTRIRELLESRHLSPTQFADLIGVGRPVISHILSGRNEPSLKVVRSIIDAFPDVSLSWIMTGTGHMLTNATPTAAAPAIPTTTIPTPSITDNVPIVQNVALPAASVVSVISPLAEPAPVIATAPTPPPVSAAAPPVAQPVRLPQPPKFRPTGKIASIAEVPVPIVASVPVLPASLVAAPLATTLPVEFIPTSTSEHAASPSASISPVSAAAAPTLATATPTELPPAPSAYLAAPEAPVIAPTSPSVSTPSMASPAVASPSVPPNPAAAFSHLGEAGKTIRRIVLFYSDGSFNDYRPEGQ